MKTVIGIDVSKAKLDCLWLRDEASGKVKSKVLANNPAGYAILLKWAQQHTQQGLSSIFFVLEASGVYHERLSEALYRAGAQVCVANPAQVRDFAKSLGSRHKTDKQDSLVLARWGTSRTLRLWQPEPEPVQALKALIKRVEALDQDIQRERNRLEKEQVRQSSETIIDSIQQVLSVLEKEKQRIEDLINQHINQNPDLKQDQQLLDSIPGVGPVTSRYMMALIRSRSFESAAQCAAFIGLVPLHVESGSSVRGRPRLSKAGNPKIRAKLYMAAVVCIRHNPNIKRQYERLLKRGKAKMSALAAAMRKLVHICFGVLKHQMPYRAQTN